MKDKELIQALRCCGSTNEDACKGCPVKKECHENIGNPAASAAADRMEALLAENERLKAQAPKWVSVEERLPESNDRAVLAIVNGVYGGIHFYDAVEIAEFVWDEGWFLESYPDWENPNISCWQPLPEPPSTEGVE